jgi:hypothetical protein
MPSVGGEHERRIAGQIEVAVHQFEGVVENPLIDRLPLGVVRFEPLGELRPLGGVVRHQEAEPLGGVANAARGVEPGRQDERDLTGLDPAVLEPGGPEQRAESGPPRVLQQPEPVAR